MGVSKNVCKIGSNIIIQENFQLRTNEDLNSESIIHGGQEILDESSNVGQKDYSCVLFNYVHRSHGSDSKETHTGSSSSIESSMLPQVYQQFCTGNAKAAVGDEKSMHFDYISPQDLKDNKLSNKDDAEYNQLISEDLSSTCIYFGRQEIHRKLGSNLQGAVIVIKLLTSQILIKLNSLCIGNFARQENPMKLMRYLQWNAKAAVGDEKSMHFDYISPQDLKGLSRASLKGTTQKSPEVRATIFEHDPTSDVKTRKKFDNGGGLLELKKYGTSMTIPAGALTKETELELGVEYEPDKVPLEKDELLMGPGFSCKPCGLKLQKPATIKIPHCGILSNPAAAKVCIYYIDESKMGRRLSLSPQGVPRCRVYADYVLIEIDHFSTLYVIWQKIMFYVLGKVLKSIIYLPKFHDEFAFCRVRLQDCHRLKVESHQEGYVRTDFPIQIPINDLSKDILITCESPSLHDDDTSTKTSTKTLPAEKFLTCDEAGVNFRLKRTEKEREEVKISIPSHLSKDEHHFFHFPMAGPESNLSRSHGQRKATFETFLNDLAKDIPSGNFFKICQKLDWGHDRANNELKRYGNSYVDAFTTVISEWHSRTAGTIEGLCRKLKDADVDVRTFDNLTTENRRLISTFTFDTDTVIDEVAS